MMISLMLSFHVKRGNIQFSAGLGAGAASAVAARMAEKMTAVNFILMEVIGACESKVE